MTFLGNLVWLIFGGLLAGLGYIIGGLVMCLTIVGIPFGVQNIKLGIATFAPFGKEIVEVSDANSPLRVLFNILWLVLFGWAIAVGPSCIGGAVGDHDRRHSLCLAAHQADSAGALPLRSRSALSVERAGLGVKNGL